MATMHQDGFLPPPGLAHGGEEPDQDLGVDRVSVPLVDLEDGERGVVVFTREVDDAIDARWIPDPQAGTIPVVADVEAKRDRTYSFHAVTLQMSDARGGRRCIRPPTELELHCSG